MRRTLILVTILSFIGNLMYAQAYDIVGEINEKIDRRQYSFDSADSVTDGQITVLNNPMASERATRVYITQINALQKEINEQEDDSWMKTRDKLRVLKNWLYDTSQESFADTYWVDRVEILYNIHTDTNSDFNKETLINNRILAANLFKHYKDKPYAYDVLKSLLDENPEGFMYNMRKFKESPHLVKVVDDLVKKDPVKMKRWVNTNTPINELLYKSTDPYTQKFIHVFNVYGRASKAFYMLNDISNGTLEASAAHDIGTDPRKFRLKLIDLSLQDEGYGKEAVTQKIKEEALKVIREINDLHETKDPRVRFKAVEGLSAQEFYTYMVLTPEEIFTSTFNGFYERMIKDMGEKDAYDFVSEMKFSRYRTFIKMAAGYNKLDDFLGKMSPEKQKLILTQFVTELEEGQLEESLTAAVDVADTFGSLKNDSLKTFFSQKMTSELARVNAEENSHGIRLYSLLTAILAQSNTYSEDWVSNLVTQYDIPKINQLDHSVLENNDGVIVQQVFFYDDDDGKASYYSFLPTFRNSKWKIEDKSTYVKIAATGSQKIEIYANKPQYEFRGKDALRAHFRETGNYPSVVIHRGHSFYVDTTIKSLTPQAKLVVLGSCGGYHNLTKVLERAPDVHIISSKQIGAMAINDPMIRSLEEDMLAQKPIDWQMTWDKLNKKFKPYKKNYDRFQDYVPPHKNLGAIFIMAYNRLKEKEGV